MKPTITDWIQSIVVVIGIGFALWEFVLHDREDENAKKEAVRQLIIAGQSDSLFNSTQEITRRLAAWMDNDVSELEYVEFSAAIYPFEIYFEAWGFCIEHELCDQELSLEYVCDSFTYLEKFRNLVEKQMGEKPSRRAESYRFLLQECQSKVRGQK